MTMSTFASIRRSSSSRTICAAAKTTTPTKVAPKGTSVTNRNGKILKAGKDVKAQQFNLRVGKKAVVPVTLGFTKSNELFVGRAAMLGFASAVLGEVVTGKGALAQFNIETGIPITDIDGIVAGIVIFNLLAALLPAKGTFVADEEEQSVRPKGSLQDPSISVLQPKKFFGISGFGFTKANELFVGRMAQLGFAAALLGESITGKGPLGQLGLETGIPLSEAEPLLIFSILFTLFAAINEGSGKFVDEQ